MFVCSICLTILFYLLAGYLSITTVAILYHAIQHKLPLTILKSSLFLGITYISIITDIVLFGGSLYSSLFAKNALLIALIIISIIPVNHRKELSNQNDDKGK